MWLRVLTQNRLDLSLITKGSKVAKVQATSSSIFTAYPYHPYPVNLTLNAGPDEPYLRQR